MRSAIALAACHVQSHGGPADYILFVDGKALGIVEAKKEGATLSAVADQSARYTNARNWIPQRWADPLPFTYETTGIETNFRDQRDPDSRSRPVFAFHTPEHLLELVQQGNACPARATLRARLRQFPALNTAPLRECQIDAVTSLEKSLAANRPRALIQMATGSGKTFTAVTQAYRLIKHAGAKRILFLVDRGNLGRQTVNEFQQFTTPDDGRKFTDLYNVQMLGPGGIDPVCKVTVSTIQRLYSQLSGNATFDDEADEHSGYEVSKVAEASRLSSQDNLRRDAAATFEATIPVTYNPKIPIESFDFVIVDECHRSIYYLWRQVIEYFEKRPLTTDPVKTLTNLITLVRHTVDPQKTPLAPFPELVETRYRQWLAQQQGGKVAEASSLSSLTDQRQDASATPRFTPAQIQWLDVIKNYIALNGAFATDDQSAYLDAWQSVDSDEGVPLAVANRVFGKDALKPIIEELNEVLVA